MKTYLLFLLSVLCAHSVLAQAVSDVPRADEVAHFDLEQQLISPHGLTADVAGMLARERAPQIESAQASLESAREDVNVQRSAFLPTLNLSGQYKRISDVENNAFERDLGGVIPPGVNLPNFTLPQNNYTFAATARWPVSDLFFRVSHAFRALKHLVDARELDVIARTANAELTAREAFYAYARALATRLVAEQALKQAEAQAHQAGLLVRTGNAAPVDLVTATARLELMRSAHARADGAVEIARNALAVLLDVPLAEVDAILEPVTTLPEPPKLAFEQLLSRGLAQRPELEALRRLVLANEESRVAERNAALPVLSVEGAALEANPNPRYVPPVAKFRTSWEVGATLAWSPNTTLVGTQRAHKAAAELQKAKADLKALTQAVHIEIVRAYQDYRSADAAARSAEAQQHSAEETYRVRLASYRAGARIQLDLLTADLALTQARLEHVNAVIDARLSLARLARATGAR